MIKVITNESKEYPKLLKQINRKPQILYVEGDVNILNNNSISIIGSRCCSDNGLKQAREFAYDLAFQNITIVSGMAKGIDTSAHIGALEAGGKTIAVLGCGFKHVFPKENIGLYKKIIENGGAVISEYPPDTEPSPDKFLQRNRIVSGLSMATLVIEAAYRSGTSVTAGLAKEQGRKVFCIPHETDNMHGVGTNRLLKLGAKVAMSAKDIIECFDDLEYKEPEKKKKFNETMIKPEYIAIYRLISKRKIDCNEISRILEKPINEINSIVFMMELDGLINKLPNGEFILKEE